MKLRQRKLRDLRLALLVNVVLFSRTLAWNPDMPGGLKLVIDGDTYSFTTDMCPGGVFFKRPVFIQLTCIHGYYLTRPNGCSMNSNSVIGGQNYVCQEVNKDKTKKIQAFIPVTNPEHPLAHTISIFDESDTLKNLRRLTYVSGLEGGYESPDWSDPMGAIVTNPHKTPNVTIGNICYQGKAQISANAYSVSIPAGNQAGAESKMFSLGCDDGAFKFPWNTERVHNYTEGYSAPAMFENEIKARLLDESELASQVSLSAEYEIWGGLAYCLQTEEKILGNGKTLMTGLEPSIESLVLFCPKRRIISGLRRKRRSLRLKRKVEDIQTSIPFNILMTCVATCWKNNPDKCHKKPFKTITMPFCPPYCGGKKHRPGPSVMAFEQIYGKRGFPPPGHEGSGETSEREEPSVEAAVEQTVKQVGRFLQGSIPRKRESNAVEIADEEVFDDSNVSPPIANENVRTEIMRPPQYNYERLIGQSVPQLSSYIQTLISQLVGGGRVGRSNGASLTDNFYQPDQGPLQQYTLQQDSLQQGQFQQYPIQQESLQQYPLQQDTLQVPIQQGPLQQIPIQQIPIQQIPLQQIPLQQIPMQRIPLQQGQVQQSPTRPRRKTINVPVEVEYDQNLDY